MKCNTLISFHNIKKHRENGHQTVTLGVLGHYTTCHGKNHITPIEPLHSLDMKLWMMARSSFYIVFD